MREEWPTEYAPGLSFENSSPVHCVLLRAVYSAMIERRHAAWDDVDSDTFKDLPHLFGTLSYDFYKNIRDTIFRIAPKFINMDYDYAENEWLDFPRMHSAGSLQNDPACAIAELPFRYGQALAVRGWLERAKNCLDKMYSTVPPIEVWNRATAWGTSDEVPDGSFGSAIADSHDRQTFDPRRTPIQAKSYVHFDRFWELSVSRQPGWFGSGGSGEPYYLYDCNTTQFHNVYLRHRSPLSVIPSVVTRPRVVFYQDPNDPIKLNLFDPLGSGWSLGVNQLDKIEAYGVVSIDIDESLRDPSAIPDIPLLDEFYTASSRAVGYRASLILDWRCEGGFKFYKPE